MSSLVSVKGPSYSYFGLELVLLIFFHLFLIFVFFGFVSNISTLLLHISSRLHSLIYTSGITSVLHLKFFIFSLDYFGLSFGVVSHLHSACLIARVGAFSCPCLWISPVLLRTSHSPSMIPIDVARFGSASAALG